MTPPYSTRFYVQRDARTREAARLVLAHVFERLPPVRAVLDVGCGVGTWLAVARELGATDVLGVDGPWVEVEHLVIDTREFLKRDIGLLPDLELGRRFDLAICLEVAEHLPPRSANVLIDSLTRCADFVLFSAAIPGQPGTHHVNARWQREWAALFDERGCIAVDAVRKAFWNDQRVPYFYAQNALLYVKRDRLAELQGTTPVAPGDVLDVVHPELWTHTLSRQRSVKVAWDTLRDNLMQTLRGRGRRSGQGARE